MSPVVPVIIEDYDPRWAEEFDALQAVLSRAVGSLALAIEHVGSTAVPGLAAKPILDIDLVIASRERLPQVIQALGTLGYFHRGDLGISGRESFGRQDETVPRAGAGRVWMAHHLYVCAQDSAQLRQHLAFCDYLRQHPQAVEAYAQLKRALAERFRLDREAYVEHKTGFIREILRRASEDER
jgi:GrpB-like predicted nucleotidyltransferase (UPF0157 family)